MKVEFRYLPMKCIQIMRDEETGKSIEYEMTAEYAEQVQKVCYR